MFSIVGQFEKCENQNKNYVLSFKKIVIESVSLSLFDSTSGRTNGSREPQDNLRIELIYKKCVF